MTVQRFKYESNELGLILTCKLSPEEGAAAGVAPSGSADTGLTAYASGSRRRHGVHTRGLTLSRLVGAAPNQFTKSKFLTMLTVAAYDSAAIGDNVSVGGVSWTVSGKIPEAVR